MKIAHLISEDTGGAKTHIMTLLNQLNRMQEDSAGAFSVEVASLSDESFYREVKKAGIKATLFLQSGRLDLSVAGSLAGYIRKEGIDILHCHGGRANLIGSMIHARKLCKVVSTIHSDFRHDFDHHWLKKLLFTRINRWSLTRLDYYLTVTEAFKDLMTELGLENEKMHVVYNGVPSTEYHEILEPRKDFFSGLGYSVEEEDILIGTATRLHPIKGTEVFLEAAHIVCKAHPECRFVVAGSGDGRLLETYKAFCADNGLEDKVLFIGFQDDIHRFYSHIDINVLASYSESFSYSLLEGGLHGLPTIASAVGGIPEMIDSGRNGLLFKAGDGKELADAIEILLEDPDRAIAYGEAFKQDIVSKFSDTAMAERHLEIYRKILD